MATTRPRTVFSIEEVRQILSQPVTDEEIARRRQALRNSDRYIRGMKPILDDVKDWIRQERGEERGE